jgi:peptide alpha-N-acetyltransferase
VYGLLHRSDHNYNEAIKAYKQALRIDSDNIQILRDLSMLQIQMRDLDGFAITRHNILTLKPNGKINWLAFALAKHLTGDLRGALSVIDIYLGTLTEGAPELARGFEACELALYRNKILAEIPDNYKEALEHLSVCENVVVDRSAWLIAKATYQLKMGDYADAKQTTLAMFRRGMTENFKVHSMYMCAILELDSGIFEEAFNLPGTRTLASLIPLSDEQKQKVLDGYKNELFPDCGRSAAMQRAPMNLVGGDNFRNSLDTFMRKWLVKGVPSLCNELSSFLLVDRAGRYELAKDPMEVKENAAFKVIVDLVDGYISCLASKSKLLPDDEFEEPPSTALWVWYLRAGLHELAGEYGEGIAMCEKCLEHTPTAVDVYEVRGRLEKAAGDIKAAVDSLDKGRDLDRQDRYINNQSTKYMLQAGMEDDALQRISMFTKHEGNPEANLFDMQCSWYELELAACYANKEEWGRSLKKYGKYTVFCFCSH